MKLNLPNRLTLIRVIMVPVFMFFIIVPVAGEKISPLIAAVLFILTALTDMLDGMIARKTNQITDFGKFLDPLADKLMIFGGMLAILYSRSDDRIFSAVFVWVVFVVILRELAVTSMRLVVSSGEGIVVAANILGKVKTVSQMLCMIALLLEPTIPMFFEGADTHNVISYLLMGIMTTLTVWSGVNYLIAYLPHMKTNQ